MSIVGSASCIRVPSRRFNSTDVGSNPAGGMSEKEKNSRSTISGSFGHLSFGLFSRHRTDEIRKYRFETSPTPSKQKVKFCQKFQGDQISARRWNANFQEVHEWQICKWETLWAVFIFLVKDLLQPEVKKLCVHPRLSSSLFELRRNIWPKSILFLVYLPK